MEEWWARLSIGTCQGKVCSLTNGVALAGWGGGDDEVMSLLTLLATKGPDKPADAL